MREYEDVFHTEGGDTLEPAAQGGWGCFFPGGFGVLGGCGFALQGILVGVDVLLVGGVVTPWCLCFF